EGDVADRSEPVLVGSRPVVVNARPAARPLLEVRREARVCDHVNLVDLLDLGDPVEDPVDDRLAADLEERLRAIVRQRTQSGRVPGRKDESLHGTTGVRPLPCPDWTRRGSGSGCSSLPEAPLAAMSGVRPLTWPGPAWRFRSPRPSWPGTSPARRSACRSP